MSLSTHIIVLFFIFTTFQSAKLEDDRSTPNNTDPDAAKITFNRTSASGQLKLKISMEKDKCVKTKTETSPSNIPLKSPEEEKKEKPVETCDDVNETGNYYIKSKMSDEAFKVRCDLENQSTCLIINSKINASSIDSTAITKEDQIWLSLTAFDVQLLYNKIEGKTGTNREQISHLLSTSTSVYQKIKYYYSNGASTKEEDNKVASLKALLWNDHLVSSNITNQLPMKFNHTVTRPCWTGTSSWMCSDISFRDNSNKRLPVTDFYIEDVRANPDVLQKLYFDLVELCFKYD